MPSNQRNLEFAPESLTCTECGAADLARDDNRGEVVCRRCGLVLQEGAIDPGPEWRAFDQQQRDARARTGAPMTWMLHDKGLATDIGWSNKDSYGKHIPHGSRALMYRLRRWHRRARMHTSAERSLAQALAELDRMASKVGLPRNVRETAAMVHRRALAKGLLRGRSIDAVAAASLYAACRQCGVPRTLDEIADASRVRRKDLGRTYRLLARSLKLGLAPTAPQDYLARFSAQLHISAPTQALAAKLLKDAAGKGVTNGKAPAGLAASALYTAALLGGEHRTQQEIAQVAGVTEVTIRNRYKELAHGLGLTLPVPGLQRPSAPPRGGADAAGADPAAA
jgi:transcription initiation factor TFIIB